MDNGALIGVITAMGGILTAVGAWVISYASMKRQQKREDNQEAVTHWKEIADRQQEQLDKQDEHIEAQQRAITLLHEEHSQCQVHISDLYGFAVRLHDVTVRLAENQKKQGMDPGYIPDLPPRPVRATATADWLKLSTRRATDTLKASKRPSDPPLPPAAVPVTPGKP